MLKAYYINLYTIKDFYLLFRLAGKPDRWLEEETKQNIILMKTRKLGKTGIEVSEIAFGGVEIGIPYGIGVNSHADMLSRDKAVELLHEALDKGINFFDTARLYGESESIMGEVFHKRRDKVILSTKCRHFKDNSENIPSYNSLKKLLKHHLKKVWVI